LQVPDIGRRHRQYKDDFATQSLGNIDGSTIAPTMSESARYLLANERALEPQIAAMCSQLRLNDRQIEILNCTTPKRDYYCQSRRDNRLFELGLSELARGALMLKTRWNAKRRAAFPSYRSDSSLHARDHVIIMMAQGHPLPSLFIRGFLACKRASLESYRFIHTFATPTVRSGTGAWF
jgi:hypothetical protein